jgi:XisI protein
MDKVESYRNILTKVLSNYVEPRRIQPDGIETLLLSDTTNDHYQVLLSGWQGRKQVFLVVFHFDIKNEKIWMLQNNTDYDIIDDIEAFGVPKSDIVLAIHSPEMRPFTDYATA